MPPRQSKSIERAVTEIIVRSTAAGEGNLLVFLPGAPEIRQVERLLADSELDGRWDVAPLYGNLSRDRQDAAIAPPPTGRGKIVLTTSIAETSLTIEQIGVVVDSGLQRAPRFDPRAGMTRLVTLPVSRASADQRRGRAGRLGPGICYRLWREADHTILAAHNRPEILDTDLAGLALELALWGVTSPDALGWLDPPPSGAFEQARNLLVDLGAVDDRGNITAHGRHMAELPMHPRLAHMVLSARQVHMGRVACELAAILSERDPLHFTGGLRDADLRLRLDVIHAFKTHTFVNIPDCSVDKVVVRRILKVAALLQQRLKLNSGQESPPDAGRLLAWAYPDRIAYRRSDGVGRYLMTSGRGAFFNPPDPLGVHDLLVIAELDGDRREARIFTATAYDADTLMEQFSHRLQWQNRVIWDEQRQAVSAERRLTLDALTLRSEPLPDPDSRDLTAAMITGIRKTGIGVLPWTRALRTWQARVMLLRKIAFGEEDWPDLSDTALTADLETWLGPFLEGITGIRTLARLDLRNALHSRLSWRQQQRLDTLAPAHILVPSGASRAIDYSAEIPVLAVRIQEMFGAVETPAIADGRLPLQLHLLSPAGRPAQITQDLAGFWRNSYPAVKKELKGRYPKHYWPDDPLSAMPADRVRPRGKG